jgi:hypothetical protein
MTIEWPTGPTESDMTVEVPDNWPALPAGPAVILVKSVPFNVIIKWTVPLEHALILGGKFQLRAYVESLGPGQEMQLGPDTIVDVVPPQTAYTTTIAIPGDTLLGEGDLYYEPGAPPPPGVPVSGVYKIVAVLQHLNPGPTWVSGFAEVSFRMFLSP